MGRKPGQKCRPPGVVQSALLCQRGDVRVAGREILVHLPQVGVTGKKRQIVAHFAFCHGRQRVGEGADAGLPVPIPGGDGGQAVEPQVLGRERAFQRHGPGVRAAQHIPVVARRGQRCAEQGGGPPAAEAGVHKGGRVQAEDVEIQRAAIGRQLGGKVLVVPLCRPQDVLYLKIKVEQGCVGLGVRVLLQPVLQGSCQGLQGL